MAKTAQKRMNRAFLVLLAAIVISILLAGLWPFDFLPANGASIKNGVEFTGKGIAYAYRDQMLPDGGFTLEFTLTPYEEPSDRVGDLLSFYTKEWEHVLRVSQWKDGLIVSGSGGQARYFGGALHGNRPVFMAITFADGGVRLFINGEQAGERQPFRINGTESGWTVLGSSPEGRRNWHGKIGFIILRKGGMTPGDALSGYAAWKENSVPSGPGVWGQYMFAEKTGAAIADMVSGSGTMTIPRPFRALKKEVLLSPFSCDCRFDVKDAALNFTGFVPFALAACAAALGSGRNGYCISIVSGFSLSLFIELIQVYLPGRFSSASDLVLNGAGTAFGVLLFHFFRSRFKPSY